MNKALEDATQLIKTARAVGVEIDHLRAENERLMALIPRWIPVEERLPDSFGLNLILLLGNFCYVGFWVETEKVWFIDTPDPGARIPVSLVTHWMPIPERP